MVMDEARKQKGPLSLASRGAAAADNMYVAYSNRAASILGESALPMINEMYQRLASIHK
jgi:hypothetical protein